jgi:hypothetical protein
MNVLPTAGTVKERLELWASPMLTCRGPGWAPAQHGSPGAVTPVQPTVPTSRDQGATHYWLHREGGLKVSGS